MNKGLQILLLIALFGGCGAAGYYVGGILFNDSPSTSAHIAPQPKEVVVEPVEEVVEVEKSRTPVIENISSLTLDKSNNTYSFTVTATVESGDTLGYGVVDPNSEGNEFKYTSDDGNFSGVAAPASGESYQIVVYNVDAEESETVSTSVDGFKKVQVQPQKVKRISEEELQRSINNVAAHRGGIPAEISKCLVNHAKRHNIKTGIVDDGVTSLWTDAFNYSNVTVVVKIIYDESTNKIKEIHYYTE